MLVAVDSLLAAFGPDFDAVSHDRSKIARFALVKLRQALEQLDIQQPLSAADVELIAGGLSDTNQMLLGVLQGYCSTARLMPMTD